MSQFEYSVVRSKRRVTNTTISVGPKGVIVHAPFWMPAWVIKNFVEEKRNWIEDQLKKHPQRSKEAKIYQDGDSIYFLGNKLLIKVTETEIPVRTKIFLEAETLLVVISMHITGSRRAEEIKKSLSHWFLEKGIEEITQKVNHYSDRLGVTYSRITLKNVSSIWGSCSSKNNLNFNRHLIMAPHEVIDYVVIHEVCHLVHRDHSSRFWALVRSLDPDYKDHRRWLRDNRFYLSF